jgi:hypothetical protein
MIMIGNHIKMNVPHALRQRTREFYIGLLSCTVLPSPRDDLDLYEFDGGFVVGLFFVEEKDAPSESDYLRSAWLEIKSDDPDTLKVRLLTFGVKEVDYPDPTRFFFQAPGGQVFRLAPIEGGL